MHDDRPGFVARGVWLGALALFGVAPLFHPQTFVFGLTMLPILLIVPQVGRMRRARAERKWTQVKDDVVRTEAIEHLGHTLGGLSTADPGDTGALSTADTGQLSHPRAKSITAKTDA